MKLARKKNSKRKRCEGPREHEACLHGTKNRRAEDKIGETVGGGDVCRKRRRVNLLIGLQALSVKNKDQHQK